MFNKILILTISMFLSSLAFADTCLGPRNGFSEKYLALSEVAKLNDKVSTDFGNVDIANMVSKALLNPYSGFSIGKVQAQGGSGQMLISGTLHDVCFLKFFTFNIVGNTDTVQASWSCEAEQSADGDEFKSKITKISCKLTAG